MGEHFTGLAEFFEPVVVELDGFATNAAIYIPNEEARAISVDAALKGEEEMAFIPGVFHLVGIAEVGFALGRAVVDEEGWLLWLRWRARC